MKNFVDGPDIPLGFGMALAQNVNAMNRFATLPESERKTILDGVKNVNSHQEMAEYVNNILTAN